MKICCKCKQEKPKSEFYKNKSTKDGLSHECKECKKTWSASKSQYHKEWKAKNKEKLAIYRKRYRENNKEKERESRRQYGKHEYVRLRTRLSKRIIDVLKGKSKSKSTMELIGCNLQRLKKHLQDTAVSNGYNEFDIDSYSGYKYHIDHIIPCCKFNLSCSYHQRLCFNFNNLQILSARANIKKRDK